jgi:hypothetical protein
MTTIIDTYAWRSRNTIERHDSKDGTSVRYEFPLGFTIMADRRGVSFAGSSVNYDAGSIQEIERVIRWATSIYIAIRDGGGVPPQTEVEGHLVLQSKSGKAWWRGRYKEAVRSIDGVRAEAILRRIARERELKEWRE